MEPRCAPVTYSNINIPWSADGMTDADYLHAFQRLIMPVAYEFDPELVFGRIEQRRAGGRAKAGGRARKGGRAGGQRRACERAKAGSVIGRYHTRLLAC